MLELRRPADVAPRIQQRILTESAGKRPNAPPRFAAAWKRRRMAGYPGGCAVPSLQPSASNSPVSPPTVEGATVDRYTTTAIEKAAVKQVQFCCIRSLLQPICNAVWDDMLAESGIPKSVPGHCRARFEINSFQNK